MREADGPCRITGVVVTKAVIEAGVDGVTEIAASTALVGEVEKVKMTFGHSQPVRGGWPKEVAEAADALVEAMEEHLVGIVFEEDEDERRTVHAGELCLPPGLIRSEVGQDEEDVEQL